MENYPCGIHHPAFHFPFSILHFPLTPRLLEQLCRLVDLLFGQTGIAEHECCSRRLDRRRIVRRKRVNAHTGRLCALNKFVLEHAVAHVQQQVQAILDAAEKIQTVNYRQYDNPELARLADEITRSAQALKE